MANKFRKVLGIIGYIMLFVVVVTLPIHKAFGLNINVAYIGLTTVIVLLILSSTCKPR